MSSRDPLERLRALPRAPAPNDDAAAVKSNLPNPDVELLQNILAYHVAHRPGSSVFGNGHANRLRLVEAYVRPRREARGSPQADSSRQRPGTKKAGELEAVTVLEITVGQDMLNVHGTLSGACATLLIDIGMFSPLFALGIVADTDPTGLSASMNITWHAPAPRGTMLRLVNTSLTLKPRMAAARCEVFDGDGRLLITASQIVSPMQGRAARTGPGAVASAARAQPVAVPPADGRAKL